MALQVATFGAGCFWCIEAAFNTIDGVICAISGYSGGDQSTANYEAVSTGRTNHAEVVQIAFDESKINYQSLLVMLFQLHDPTQLNRQGNDIGRQYRSVIFYHTQEQRLAALDLIEKLTQGEVFDKPIVTQIEPLTNFYPAEPYHQAYFENHPNEQYCTAVIAPKLAKFKVHSTKQD